MSFAATVDGEGFSMPSSGTDHLGGLGVQLLGSIFTGCTEEGCILKREREGRWGGGEWDSKRRNEIERELETVKPDVILWVLGSFGPYISQLLTDKNYLCVSSSSTWRGRQMTLVCIWVPLSPYPTCVIRNGYGKFQVLFPPSGKISIWK